MDQMSAILIAEGQQPAEDDDQYYEAWQYLIDSGTINHLQGWFQRTAEAMVLDGLLTADMEHLY